MFKTFMVTPEMGVCVFLFTIQPEILPLVWALIIRELSKAKITKEIDFILQRIIMQFITINIPNSLTKFGN